MSQNYAIIDPSNNIVNIVVYAVGDIPPNPHPVYPDCTFVACSDIGKQCDGWTYVNGEFIAPPIVSIEPIAFILPTPTLAELQAQMAQIQAHMSALLANGSSSETSLTGEVGPIGEMNLSGEVGPTGLTGPMDETGLTGEVGPHVE